MCVKLFQSWFLNSASNMNLKSVWPLLCILKQGWIEYGPIYYRVKLVIGSCLVCWVFSFFYFSSLILMLLSSVSTSECCMFALVPGKNFLLQIRDIMVVGILLFQTNYQNSKSKEQTITKLWKIEKLQGLYLGLFINIEIFITIQIYISDEN